MKNTKKRGFTIVELVIVIAVIAILASVLIPTFTKVVQAAKDSKNLQEARNAYTEAFAEHLTETAEERTACTAATKHTDVNGWTVKFTGDTQAEITNTNDTSAKTYVVDANGKFDVKPAENAGGGQDGGGAGSGEHQG